jgi:hypothetical protein
MNLRKVVLRAGIIGAVFLSGCTVDANRHEKLGLEHFSPALQKTFETPTKTTTVSSRSMDDLALQKTIATTTTLSSRSKNENDERHEEHVNSFLASTSDDPGHFSNTAKRTDELIDGLNMTITVDHKPATGVMHVIPAPKLIQLPLPHSIPTGVTHLAQDLSPGVDPNDAKLYGYSLDGNIQEVLTYSDEWEGKNRGLFYGRKNGDTTFIVTAGMKDDEAKNEDNRYYHEITLVGTSFFSITSNGFNRSLSGGEMVSGETTRRVIGDPRGHFLVMEEGSFSHVYLYRYSEGSLRYSWVTSTTLEDFKNTPFEKPEAVEESQWEKWIAYVTADKLEVPFYPTETAQFNGSFIRAHFLD